MWKCYVSVQSSGNIKSQFLLEFVLCFFTEMLCFISNKMSTCDQTKNDDRIEPDEEEKEVIYYIAGSIMRGYLRIAYRYQDSNKWKCIMNNIKKRILTDQPVGYSNWLLSVDRGGLYVTRECQDLFVGVAKIVYASEKRDGSIAMAMSLKQ